MPQSLGSQRVGHDLVTKQQQKREMTKAVGVQQPGKKVMTNLDSVVKSRDITLSTNVCLVKAMFFPVVMCGCESWTARRSNQSILKETSPGSSLEGLMLRLKLQCFGHLMS